jgi:hypothetical protein
VALVVERFDDIGVIRLSRWIFNCYLIRGENSNVGGRSGHARTAQTTSAGCGGVARRRRRGGRHPRAQATTSPAHPRLAAEHGWGPCNLPEVTLGYLDGTRSPAPRAEQGGPHLGPP